MEIVLSFAFIALFSIILPIVPFLAYVSVIFEVRISYLISFFQFESLDPIDSK